MEDSTHHVTVAAAAGSSSGSLSDMEMTMNPVRGQIIFTAVSILALTKACLSVWRYNSGSAWDAKMESADAYMTSFNSWKFSHYVSLYGKISLWGVAAIF